MYELDNELSINSYKVVQRPVHHRDYTSFLPPSLEHWPSYSLSINLETVSIEKSFCYICMMFLNPCIHRLSALSRVFPKGI